MKNINLLFIFIFFVQYYTQFILNLMKKLCAPVRDDSIQNLTLLKDPVDVFKGITEVNYFTHFCIYVYNVYMSLFNHGLYFLNLNFEYR